MDQRPEMPAPSLRAGCPARLAIEHRHPWQLYRRGGLTLAFAGVAFNSSPEAILEALSSWREVSPDRVTALARSIDGHFAFAATSDDWALAVVDRVRSIPLFLAKADGIWQIDNQAWRLSRAAGFGAGDIDRDAALQIAMAGYTVDTATLYGDLMMPGPGDCIVIPADGKPVRRRYYTYAPCRVAEAEEQVLRRRLAEVTLAVIEKTLKSLDRRPLVVPLSAGFDSRLIISAARHLGYPALKCFSYGRAGNFEGEAARAIAERLNVPWQFVPSTIAGQRAYFASTDHAAYLDYADSCASSPFEQDLVPLRALKASGFVPDDAVLANGNSGDFISGNHVVPKLRTIPTGLSEAERRDRILDALIDKHFALWGHLRTRDNLARILAALAASLDAAQAKLGDPSTDHGLYEYAEFQDRQCKYVITGQRIYEFLGHDWRLPLWDSDYLDFWESVPLHLKAGQKLYADMLHEQNWGGVWRDVPINDKTIRPLWIVPLRLAAKAARAPFGRARWHQFERRVFSYWMDATCNSACVPYRQTVQDRRGARLSVSWLAERYLARHGIAVDDLAREAA